jgi:hypothetical protein
MGTPVLNQPVWIGGYLDIDAACHSFCTEKAFSEVEAAVWIASAHGFLNFQDCMKRNAGVIRSGESDDLVKTSGCAVQSKREQSCLRTTLSTIHETMFDTFS